MAGLIRLTPAKYRQMTFVGPSTADMLQISVPGHTSDHSGMLAPEPPISLGTSLSLVTPSLIGSTDS